MIPTPLDKAFRGKSVLVTGHTGFKGGWLSSWLKLLGAQVAGFSLLPEPERPSLFERARIEEGLASILGDIREPSAIERAFQERRPEIVFHLAAQSLVRRSYREPSETFATNVLGTAHVLEAARRAPSVRAVVVVTSDKCYAPRTDGRPHREDDPLGGRDPYSASKAAAEMVVASYRSAYFPPETVAGHRVGLASARAGNVIGGGDWAEDRLVPDCIRALSAERPVPVRNPDSIRPWQHVLEPLSGYLRLAQRLLEDPARFAGAWNFGPAGGPAVPVMDLVRRVLAAWGAEPSRAVVERDPKAPHETATLRLDPSKAASELGWRAVYSVQDGVAETVAWYKELAGPGADGRAFTERQIEAYVSRARKAGLAWAGGSGAPAAEAEPRRPAKKKAART